MEDPAFKLHGIHIVNIILTYFYGGLLIMCFILSLGNRPQGSKWGYTAAFIGFGVITIYMTVRFIYRLDERFGIAKVILYTPGANSVVSYSRSHPSYLHLKASKVYRMLYNMPTTGRSRSMMCLLIPYSGISCFRCLQRLGYMLSRR